MTEAPESPTSSEAGRDSDEVSRAVDAAIANAALEGIEIPEDERALIEAHQRGELSHERTSSTLPVTSPNARP